MDCRARRALPLKWSRQGGLVGALCVLTLSPKDRPHLSKSLPQVFGRPEIATSFFSRCMPVTRCLGLSQAPPSPGPFGCRLVVNQWAVHRCCIPRGQFSDGWCAVCVWNGGIRPADRSVTWTQYSHIKSGMHVCQGCRSDSIPPTHTVVPGAGARGQSWAHITPHWPLLSHRLLVFRVFGAKFDLYCELQRIIALTSEQSVRFYQQVLCALLQRPPSWCIGAAGGAGGFKGPKQQLC